MLKIGEKQILRIDKQVPFGFYLTGDVPNERVLLPRSQVPEGAAIGDELEVFLYKDSEDRLIATRKEPKLTLHQVGYLTVIQVSRIGAFLDWGLEKDLLLPYHEQRGDSLRPGDEVLCAVYEDKSGRLCATMNVYHYLRNDAPYKAGDTVTGTVYETSGNFGTFVAVDDIYSALIPKQELVRPLKPGETVTVNLADLVDTYTGQSGATANVAIAADGKVSASVNVSAQAGNIIEAKSDGIYAGIEWQSLA